MSRHVMSFTYKEKIPAVIEGNIRQTIRPEVESEKEGARKRIIRPGDTITFHGWEEKPYRSPWSFRKEVTVTEVIPITIFSKGIVFRETNQFELWDSDVVNELARLDGIVPPTGEALCDVLYRFNHDRMVRQGTDFLRMRIIRW